MLNIIVVEDEAPIRDWIVYNISKISDDYKVLSSANNGKEGFELIKDLKPEVIIISFSILENTSFNSFGLISDLIKYSKTPQLIACFA